MKVAKVVDAKEACCMDTLSSPIEEALATIAPEETIQVLVRPSFQRMVYLFAQDKGYTVLEEIKQGEDMCFTLGRPDVEKKRENCMVCGGPLEYLTEAVSVACLFCGKQDRGYVRCPRGHYVCDSCHGKGAYEAIKDIALSSKGSDPLALSEIMMSHPSIPMLGCENAIVVAAAFMAALRNRKFEGVEDKHIIEAMDRTQQQSISAYCGLTGVCGVPVAIGAVFSVILGAECPKDRETSITMHAVGRVVEAIANDTGPCCCKSFVWTGLTVGHNLAKEYLGVRLPIHRETVVCSYYRVHPHGCQGARCAYFPKRARKVIPL